MGWLPLAMSHGVLYTGHTIYVGLHAWAIPALSLSPLVLRPSNRLSTWFRFWTIVLLYNRLFVRELMCVKTD